MNEKPARSPPGSSGRRFSPRARRYLAVDLGAGSGRVMLGVLDEGKLHLEEAHRFPNEPVRLHETLIWDFPRLFGETLKGLEIGGRMAGGRVDGIGVDSWGVDFGLLDASGGLLANPVHYRDSRTQGILERVLEKVPREVVFAETGVQFLPLNTLYQLAALAEQNPGLLSAASRVLLMADLVHYFLAGRAASELTLASTTQMWNQERRAWSVPLIEAIGIPQRILPEVVDPGCVLGALRPDLARNLGLHPETPVIAPACHDTACAVAAVPALPSPAWAFLSCGTWSLAGIELSSPCITREALARNFTNECGASGTTRFLRNLNGLWIVEECRRRWARGGEDMDHPRLRELASAAGPSRSFIRPSDPAFFAPPDMPLAIRDYCARTGQEAPGSPGEIVRCALESLALAYGEVFEDARDLSGRSIERVHIVGGGSRDDLHSQITADALGLPVLAGPVEATALGNILLQAMATGDVGSLEDLRGIVRESTATRTFLPRERTVREENHERYRKLPRS